jgi:hypothetical protein
LGERHVAAEIACCRWQRRGIPESGDGIRRAGIDSRRATAIITLNSRIRRLSSYSSPQLIKFPTGRTAHLSQGQRKQPNPVWRRLWPESQAEAWAPSPRSKRSNLMPVVQSRAYLFQCYSRHRF